jgi:hypothetical protein
LFSTISLLIAISRNVCAKLFTVFTDSARDFCSRPSSKYPTFASYFTFDSARAET